MNSAQVRKDVFLPAVREAVKDWLDAVKKLEKFRRLVEDIQVRGVGSNTFCPFNDRVPVTLADYDGFIAFAAELVGDGFTDAESVKAVFAKID